MQHERSAETRAAEHVSALEQRIDALQHEQRAQANQLQQADTTNRVLRDELLGIGQRAALLGDSVSQLADPAPNGAHADRLDELEPVRGLGHERPRALKSVVSGKLGSVMVTPGSLPIHNKKK